MRIAFVGASGYGNVGDDTYPLVFREHLPGHELFFFNSDLPREMPEGIRLLVLGGGGIIYNSQMDPPEAESPHFVAMKHYLEWARRSGVPWGFLSCGVQFAIAAGQSPKNTAALKPWEPWLRDAAFVTVRSPVCKRVIDALGSRADTRFFPDSAYLFGRQKQAGVARGRTRQFTVVPAGVINVHDPFVQHFLAPFERASGWTLVWLNMGAMVDAGSVFDDARHRYPGSVVIERPTPDEAYAQIAASSFVLSGRYHGMVFARSCGVPFFVPQDAPSKIRHEDYTTDPAQAIGHIDTIREHVARLTAGA
ncbi:MAG: polysaccharide pyruvyl transferase family protein [Verrucomicrobiaceae bacterium]|nr:polysaccharide pyruvyl transferase family protein [Verrucomicrobiaceae bacterium]